MKKAMLHTKVSVKLRKSELRDEWYLYLEAYPVFKPGHDKPCREREYLNRIITTPMWDKTRPARIDKDGVQTYKPKRDMNGIIICRSKTDRETCIFVDNVRNLRQPFNRFKSSIVILFKFNAKVLTIFGITMIKAFFFCFYNEFAAESSLYVLFAWHYSVSVISNQTAFHHS